MIIGLSGYAQSGKDTVAQILVDQYGFERIAFADAIRELSSEINPHIEKGIRLNEFVDEYGWDVAKQKPEIREFLQKLGVGCRKVINESVWISVAMNKMNNYKKNFVITDVRFKNEVTAVVQMGGAVWRVNRPGVTAVNGHVSEHDLDNYSFNAVINNDSTVEALDLQVAFLYKAEKDRTTWNANQTD
jgi:uncharacterized protein (DUF2132 family)